MTRRGRKRHVTPAKMVSSIFTNIQADIDAGYAVYYEENLLMKMIKSKSSAIMRTPTKRETFEARITPAGGFSSADEAVESFRQKVKVFKPISVERYF